MPSPPLLPSLVYYSLYQGRNAQGFRKKLRGDVRHEAIDIYNHIDKKELKESYLAHIPQLGI